MKVLTVVGARPQFIKAAMVSKVLKNEGIEEILVHTGQHFDNNMSQIFFDELEIPEPKYNLNISGSSHSVMTGLMMIEIEKVVDLEAPTHILVYGDTNSTLAGALVASKSHITLLHVEAGLRSFNRQMPEEVNRIVTDRLSDLLFTPSESGFTNLINEGYDRTSIFEVGDVMYDSVLNFSSKKFRNKNLLTRMGLIAGNYILATIHRAENTNDKAILKNIFKLLDSLATEVPVIMPIHPRTRAIMSIALENYRNIKIIEPVGYVDMLTLQAEANFIMTDSGGVQKEGYFLGKKIVTLRSETEWVELVKSGWNLIVDPAKLPINVNFIWDFVNGDKMEKRDFYGNGQAANKIVEIIKRNIV